MSRLINRRPIITHINPKSPISEAYRTLRTNIEFSSVDREVKIIMMTSAGPGEGKSTSAANLATVYAQADKKVLLIDADLRKPTMHHTFVKTNRIGLTSILTSQVTWSEAVQQTDIPNLDLLTSGPIPPNPSEIVSSQRMHTLLGELRSHYDVILIDTPPALAVTDAQIIATQSDGVIFVIDSGKVKRDAALKVKQNLEHVKARILGVVLNNVNRQSRDSYYYYYYGTKEN